MAGLFETTSIPGHLAPTAERLERLLAKQTLEELYEVEEQPFARGKYATVRRCRERSSGQQWAAKFLRKRRRAQELRAEALHEVAVLDAAAHCPRLVSLHQVFETPTEMVLVLELAPGGELQMVLDRDEIPEERQVAKLLRQILDGVAFLHSLNVAHLDIKPQNLVLTGDFPDCDVKLCDFGISRYISQGADIREILGTPDYIAPEVLNYEPISLATDMWSVGVLLYVLLTGCSPFGGDTKQETFCNISRCKLDFPDDLFEDVSQEAQDLIRRLIVKSPSERLSASECLQHPWLSQFEDDEAVSLFVSEASEIPEEETTAPEPAAVCDTSETSSRSSSESPSPSSSISSSRCSSSSPELLDSPASPIEDSMEETTTASTCIENQTATLEEQPALAPASPEQSATPEQSCWRAQESYIEDDDDDDDVQVLSPDTTITLEDSAELDGGGVNHRRRRHLGHLDDSESSSPSPDDFSFASERRRLNSSMPSASSMLKHHHFTGLSSERRSNFKRSMDFLARKFSASTDLLEVFDDFEIETSSCRRSSVNAMSASVSEVFKCSPVFILGEEQQCSDSGSDTVSEISTDSSSDRSSIYSDDSLDFILYGKTNHQQHGRVSFPFSATESQSWKQRNIHGAASGLRHGPRVWPRECSGVVSKALSRFTTVDLSSSSSSVDSANSAKSTNTCASSTTSSSSSISIASSSITRTSTTRNSITGLEALRTRGENLVVIREPVKAGRYTRYSEVKCESVQARIRRLHVQNSSS